MNILDAAFQVLMHAKKPMKCADLAAEMMRSGLWQAGGSTPKDSVGASIYDDIKKLGGKSRFAKAGHGYFMLSDISTKGSKSNEGFVYILTHPCFLPNIVKIGKTQGTVECRAKQLFTTALPKEFNIFATLRTSKFAETEELIHDYFNAKRISPKREFFNISPEEALKVFRKVQRLLSDCEISEDWKRERVYEEDESPSIKSTGTLRAGEKASLAFFMAFNKHAENRKDFMSEFSLHAPNKYGFYDFGIKRSRYHVQLRVTTKKGDILSGLYFSGDKVNYDSYLAIHDDVEKFIGEPIDWRWAKKDGAFSAVKKFDITGPRATWPEAFDWLCSTAIKFKRLDERFGAQKASWCV